MALIKCRECKKEISDKAFACPYCGYKKNNIKKKLLFIFCIVLLSFVVLTMIKWISVYNINKAMDKLNQELVGEIFTNAQYTPINNDSHKYGSKVSKNVYAFKSKSEVDYYYDNYTLYGYENNYTTGDSEIASKKTYKYEIISNEIVIYKNNEKDIYIFDEDRNCIFNKEYQDIKYCK